jgi:hypothetical protein
VNRQRSETPTLPQRLATLDPISTRRIQPRTNRRDRVPTGAGRIRALIKCLRPGADELREGRSRRRPRRTDRLPGADES